MVKVCAEICPDTWCNCGEKKAKTTPRKYPLQAPAAVKATSCPFPGGCHCDKVSFYPGQYNIQSPLISSWQSLGEGSGCCCFCCQKTRLSISTIKNHTWSYQSESEHTVSSENKKQCYRNAKNGIPLSHQHSCHCISQLKGNSWLKVWFLSSLFKF